MKLYITAGMTGHPGWNLSSFDVARDALIQLGHDPVSPADHDREVTPNIEAHPCYAKGDPNPLRHELLTWDIRQVLECEGIVVLPGRSGRGAALEKAVARETGRRLFYLVTTDGGGVGMPWVPGAEFRLVELPPPVVVGLSGYGQSGKSLAALTLSALGFVEIGTGDAIREALYVLNPSIKVKGNWTKLQTHVQRVGWEEAKRLDGVRRLLQRLGDEVAQITGETTWSDVVSRRIEDAYTGFDETPEPARFVVSSVRYPADARNIVHLGGEVWRIDREGYGPINNHRGETALDDWSFDARITNDGADLTLYTNVIAETACLRGLLDDDTTERLLEFFAIAEPDRATQSS